MNTGDCRLCFKNESNLCNVFENTEDDISLAEKIKICVGVEIKEDDVVTKNICRGCAFFYNAVYEFRVSAQQRDEKKKKEYEEWARKAKLQNAKTMKLECVKKEGSESANKTSTQKNKNNNEKSETTGNTHLNTPNEIDFTSQTSTKHQNYDIDPSVIDIFINNPNLEMPRSCITKNMLPQVVLIRPTVTSGKLSERAFYEKSRNTNDNTSLKETITVTYETIKNKEDIDRSVTKMLTHNSTVKIPKSCVQTNMLPSVVLNNCQKPVKRQRKQANVVSSILETADLRSSEEKRIKKSPRLKQPMKYF